MALYELDPDTPGITEWRASGDPSGNGNPAAQLYGKDASGAEVETGIFAISTGGKVELWQRAMPASALTVFHPDANGRLRIVAF